MDSIRKLWIAAGKSYFSNESFKIAASFNRYIDIRFTVKSMIK
jgi:hypothetical protein